MTDKEKVIKALECRKDAGKRCENPCVDNGACPYAYSVQRVPGESLAPFICNREKICEDAIELLKEPDAVKPTTRDGITFYCGNCGFQISFGNYTGVSLYSHCPECGRKVKWE